MCDLRVSVAVLAAPCKRDDMINMEIISINRLTTDAADTLIALKKYTTINMLHDYT